MTAVERVRERETVNINQSLSVLGKVFLALLNKKSHVPYRDSKLTHYLKDSLGGESKTMIIMQVSPSVADAAETISTLNFGQRVQQVEKGQVNPHVRETTQLSTEVSPRRAVSSTAISRFRSKSHNKLIPVHSQTTHAEYSSGGEMGTSKFSSNPTMARHSYSNNNIDLSLT